MHYYKFNIKDWTRDTAHLSVIEEGLYRRLLDHYYESEKPIPKETGSVIRRLRLSGHEDVLELILSEFFVLSDDGYRHKRCDDEISRYHAKAEVNQRNGKSGGRPKTENNPDGYQKKANGNLNHKPLTTNQEPITNSITSSDDDKIRNQDEKIDYQGIIDLYHKILPELPKVVNMTDKRRKAIRTCANTKKSYSRLDFWEAYFNQVRKSDFLMGRSKDWKANIDFLTQHSSFIKVIEGAYK